MHSGSPYRTALRRLAHGSVKALVIYGISAGLAYCAQLVIARLIGAQGYGIFAYVFAWATVLAYFSALGFDVSLLRFIPTYRAQDTPSLARGIIRYAERLAASVGIGLAIVVAIAILFWVNWPAELSGSFLIGLALIPVWALLWIRCSTARAFGGVISALGPERIVRDGVLILLLGLAGPVLGWHLDSRFAIGAALVSSLLALGLVSLAAWRLRPRALRRAAAEYAGGIWLRAAAPLVLIGTVEPLLNRSGVILLGWMGNVTAAGFYAMAFNVAFLVVLPRTAVNALFAPAAAELFARHDQAGLQALITRTAIWTLLGAICVALPMGLLANVVLGWLGKGFESGALAMRILLLGQVIAAGAGSPLYLMTMTGHERPAAMLLVLSAIINVSLGLVLIRWFGLSGAAMATSIAFIFWNITMGVFIERRLKLVPGILGLVRTLPGTGDRLAMVGSSAGFSSDHPSNTGFR